MNAADLAIDTMNTASRSVICGAARFLQRLPSDDAPGGEPLWVVGDHPWLASFGALAIWYAVTAIVAMTK